jgi:hypothetical protein
MPIGSAAGSSSRSAMGPTKMIVDCEAAWDSASLATMLDVFRDVAPPGCAELVHVLVILRQISGMTYENALTKCI